MLLPMYVAWRRPKWWPEGVIKCDGLRQCSGSASTGGRVIYEMTSGKHDVTRQFAAKKLIYKPQFIFFFFVFRKIRLHYIILWSKRLVFIKTLHYILNTGLCARV
jgi:hypothetical protein